MTTPIGPDVIGLRLTGDATSLQTTLKESGKQVGDFGRRAQEDLNRFAAGATQSAKQVEWATRGLPAQFTDIWTSLAAGQNPMTVFIQQGGQIKDMFGGIGPAARAMSSYVVGLVNPFTLAAGAAGLLAVAYQKGQQEAVEYTRAIVMSGNAAGVTGSQMAQMAQDVSKITGTVGGASRTLVALVASGEVASQSLVRFAATAQKLDDIDVPIKDTVKNLTDLGRDPVDALVKLNRQYGFLTESVYRQVKALEDQGRMADAGRLAQATYMSAMDVNADRVKGSLGFLETAWKAVGREAKSAWDAMLNLGREQTLAEQLETVRKLIAQRADRNATLGIRPGAATQELRQHEANLQEMVRLERRGADAAAARVEVTRAAVEWDSKGVQYLTQQAKMQRDILLAREQGRAAGRSDVEIEERIKAIRESYKKAPGANPYDGLIKGARDMVAVSRLELDATEELTEGEKARAKYLEQLSSGLIKYNTENDRLVMGLYAEAIAHQKAGSAREAAVKLAEANAKILAKNNDAADREVESLIKRVSSGVESNAQLREEIALIGVDEAGRTRRLQVMEHEAIKRLELDAIGLRNIEGTDAQVAAIEREIAVRRERLGLLDDKALGQVIQQSSKDREKILEEQKRDALQVAESLTDNLMRGGRSFWQYMKDAARTTVLRPVILGGVQAGMNLAGLGGGASAGAAGANGIGSMIGNWGMNQGLGSLFPSVTGMSATNMVANGASAMGFGNFAAGLTGTGGSFASTVGAGLATDAMGATVIQGASAASIGSAGAGAGAALGAIPVVGWIALAVMAISALSKKGGGPKMDGRFGEGFNSLIGTGDNSLMGSVRPLVESTQSQYDQWVRMMGGQGGDTRFGLAISRDPRGTSPSFLESAATRNGTQIFANLNRNVGRSDEDLQAALTHATQESLLLALRAADLPGLMGDYLRSIEDVSSDVENVYVRVNKALTERATLEQRLLELTGTELDKLNRTREEERKAIDATNRPLLDQVYAEEDLVRLRGGLLDAYTRESQVLEQAAEGHRSYARELREYRDSLVTGSSSPLLPGARTSAAERRFQAIARGDTLGDLRAAGGDYLGALSASASSRAEYALGFARVGAALTLAAAGAESKASIEEQQLATMKSQLTALGLLNTNLQAFAEALSAYQGGAAVAAAAKAAVAAANSSYVAGASPAAVLSAAEAVASGVTGVVPGAYYEGADHVGTFAQGGNHWGGLRIVGERGMELEATGPARIYNARETQEILSGGMGGGAERKLAAVCQLLERQQFALEASVSRQAAMARDLAQMRKRGIQTVNPLSGEVLRVEVA